MKTKFGLFAGAIFSLSVLAQPATDVVPAASAVSPASAGAPVGVVTKTSGAKQDAASQLRTVPLVPGPAVVDANHVNVRGQARLKSEIVARLDKGQSVTVLEEITLKNSGPDEPSAWAKILLPTNTHVWVSSRFIRPDDKTVLPRRLNVRSGPGENYSILGRILRGETVVETGGIKNGWIEILPPTNTYAFMAAQYLKQEVPAAAPASPETPAEAPMATANVAEAPTIAAAPTGPPTTVAPVEAPPPTNTTSETTAEVASTTDEPPAEQPPPKRIVDRQGVVRGTGSIQAPTRFALYSVDTGRIIDYLYTTSPYLDLSRYKGLQIIVRGEEGLEDRWGNTPIITIQEIHVLE